MGITALESCVTAIYLGARFADASVEALLSFAASAGGDVDTVGAMGVAIWGARNGYARLPQVDLQRLEDVERIDELAVALYERAAGG